MPTRGGDVEAPRGPAALGGSAQGRRAWPAAQGRRAVAGGAGEARDRREKKRGSERREEERKTTGVLFSGFAECQIAGTRQRIF
jgi:hypothetical protein